MTERIPDTEVILLSLHSPSSYEQDTTPRLDGSLRFHHIRTCLQRSHLLVDYSNSNVTTVTKVATNLNKLYTDDLIEFKIADDTVGFYINETQYSSATLDWLHTPIWLYGQSWSTNNGNISIKDFKVKKIED